MADTMVQVLTEHGYSMWKKEYNNVLWKETQDVVYVVHISKYLKGQESIGYMEYEKMNQHLQLEFQMSYHKRVNILNLILTKDSIDEQLGDVIKNLSVVWVILEDEKRLCIYENQTNKFDNLYIILDSFLLGLKNQEYAGHLKEKDKFPITSPVTITIIAINILVYIYLTTKGDVYDGEFMFRHGASLWQAVVFDKEYYRLFTCMFLHFGMDHLLNNMFVFAFIGDDLERRIGKLRLLTIYLGSGIIASITSVFYHMYINDVAVSAGASGAIYGMVGALLWVILISRKEKGQGTIPRFLIFIGGTIYLSYTQAGVDNAAHIGGLIAGFILCAILFRKKNKNQNI